MLLNLIEKGTVHVFLAILAYVHDALWKMQLVASFSKALKGNAIHMIFKFSNLKLSQERWFFLCVSYSDLRTGHSTKAAIDSFFGREI